MFCFSSFDKAGGFWKFTDYYILALVLGYPCMVNLWLCFYVAVYQHFHNSFIFTTIICVYSHLQQLCEVVRGWPHGQAMECGPRAPACSPEVLQCVGGVAGVRTPTASELLHLYWVQMAPSSLLPTPSFPKAALLVRTEQRSDSGPWRRVFGFCTGISCWGSLSQRPLLSLESCSNCWNFQHHWWKMKWYHHHPVWQQDVVTILCSVRRKNILGRFKKYRYAHTHLLYKHMCCSDVGKDDCSVNVRVFASFYLGSRAQTT